MELKTDDLYVLGITILTHGFLLLSTSYAYDEI